jgi:hypothetical protein
VTVSPAQARTALIGIRLGLGAVAWLAPGTLAKVFGLSPDDPSLPFLLRLFGARDVALGLLLQAAEGDEAQRIVEVGIAVDVADSAAGLLAAARGRVPRPAALLAAGVAAGAAGLGVLARDV